MRSQFRGAAALTLAAFIWGTTFVAQSIGSESLGPFSYNGLRTLLGAAVLLPAVLYKEKKARGGLTGESRAAYAERSRKTWISGAILGLALCVASNLQQAAFSYTASGKIAFITAMYILLVPLFGLALGKRPPAIVWGGLLVGVAGLYFLSFPAGGAGGVNAGDLLSLGCAAGFAVQILLVERYAAENDAVKLSFIQFLVSGTVSCILMVIFETPTLAAIKAGFWPLAYAGVLSCGVAYTLQVVGQKHTESTLASLIMCAESVFAVLGAAVVLHEIPTGREILGCALMLAAILTVQLAGIRRTEA